MNVAAAFFLPRTVRRELLTPVGRMQYEVYETIIFRFTYYFVRMFSLETEQYKGSDKKKAAASF